MIQADVANTQGPPPRRAPAEFDPERMERLDTLAGGSPTPQRPASRLVLTGWLDFPVAADLGGRVTLTTQVLQEMRGAAHIDAIVACGLTPLDAHPASTNAPARRCREPRRAVPRW